MFKLGMSAVFVMIFALQGCGSQPTEQSDLSYVAFPVSSARRLGIADVHNETIRICLNGSVNPSDLEKAKLWAVQSALAWLRAVVVLDESVTSDVQLSCTNPSLSIRLLPGRGRSFASGRNMTIYIGEGYGTWTHELGHAFAALGDTYTGSTAGACQAGQPQSLMCWGAYGPRKDPVIWSTLWSDDIAGVQSNFKKLYPQTTAPDWAEELNLETTFDVSAPWPGAAVTDKSEGHVELTLDDRLERLGSSEVSEAL